MILYISVTLNYCWIIASYLLGVFHEYSSIILEDNNTVFPSYCRTYNRKQERRQKKIMDTYLRVPLDFDCPFRSTNILHCDILRLAADNSLKHSARASFHWPHQSSEIFRTKRHIFLGKIHTHKHCCTIGAHLNLNFALYTKILAVPWKNRFMLSCSETKVSFCLACLVCKNFFYLLQRYIYINNL